MHYNEFDTSNFVNSTYSTLSKGKTNIRIFNLPKKIHKTHKDYQTNIDCIAVHVTIYDYEKNLTLEEDLLEMNDGIKMHDL